MKKHDKDEHKAKTENTSECANDKQVDANEPKTTEAATQEERIAQLESLLAAKESEARENWDRFLRERADLENLRKRTNKEKEELLNYGTKSLLEEILPVVDNLERALEHANEDTLTALTEGIRMTHSILISALKKFGATPIESTGTTFDPAFHQAMSQTPTDDFPPNTVVTEFQKGYLLKERLLRPAMVSVSVAPK
jgi:molecular chaperone GrpE